MSYELYLLDALEITLRDEYADTLDDAAFSEAVKSQAAYLAGIMYD